MRHFLKGPSLTLHLNLYRDKLSSCFLAPHEKKGLSVTAGEPHIPQNILDWIESCDFLENPSLTLFQSRVLEALKKVAFGEKTSYQALAKQVGSPYYARAVGNCCRVNPFPLFIPCHRVLSKDGSLGGFAYGDALKKEMLSFEGIYCP